jgi:phosphoribosyl-ATP pyrophosphohydrolase/phosphoribosyl-AMP cyclohydrolase
MKTLQIKNLSFDTNGLIPAIIQDSATGRVIMFAWMNQESLDLSVQSGETVFYSRSRQELWHKGATSGNVQTIDSIEVDCDSDALLIRVVPQGPACHTGLESCFDSGLIGVSQ